MPKKTREPEKKEMKPKRVAVMRSAQFPKFKTKGTMRTVKPGSMRTVKPGSMRTVKPGSMRTVKPGSMRTVKPGSMT